MGGADVDTKNLTAEQKKTLRDSCWALAEATNYSTTGYNIWGLATGARDRVARLEQGIREALVALTMAATPSAVTARQLLEQALKRL